MPHSLARERPRRRTPSGSENAIIKAEQIFNPQSSVARELGTEVHELFESIEWWSPEFSLPIDSELQVSNAAVEQVQNCLQSREFQSVLSRPSSNSTVWRERNFEIILDGEWLSGTFDRVVIEPTSKGNPSSATIIDFKTDRVTSEEDHEAALTKYHPQLETYRAVLSKLLQIPISAIEAKLLFTRSGRVVVVR